jgi:hypothetical protein
MIIERSPGHARGGRDRFEADRADAAFVKERVGRAEDGGFRRPRVPGPSGAAGYGAAPVASVRAKAPSSAVV